jgi:aminoglycoside phosphotransferase (APT) family kinase protein
VNVVLSFLAGGGAGAIDAPDSFVLVTPQDQSSRYVVFLLLERGAREPSLVAKVPRLPEYGDALTREGELLAAVQGTRPEGFDSIPRLVALHEHEGCLILVQTAITGRAIDHATVRRGRARAVDGVLEWLDELPADPNAGAVEPGWFERLLETPLRRLSEGLEADRETQPLIARTAELLEPLRSAEIPLVLEHGDVGHPNLIWMHDGRVGVVDWELAQLRGLPAHDLFFFLTYASFASGRAWTRRRQLRVFDRAFFRQEGWTLPAARGYARRRGIPESLLRQLFLACWVRQTASLLERVGGDELRRDAVSGPTGRSRRRSITSYIQQNAYFALWRHTVGQFERLRWHD